MSASIEAALRSIRFHCVGSAMVRALAGCEQPPTRSPISWHDLTEHLIGFRIFITFKQREGTERRCTTDFSLGKASEIRQNYLKNSSKPNIMNIMKPPLVHGHVVHVADESESEHFSAVGCASCQHPNTAASFPASNRCLKSYNCEDTLSNRGKQLRYAGWVSCSVRRKQSRYPCFALRGITHRVTSLRLHDQDVFCFSNRGKQLRHAGWVNCSVGRKLNHTHLTSSVPGPEANFDLTMDPFVEGVSVDVVRGNYEGQTGTVEGHTVCPPHNVRSKSASSANLIVSLCMKPRRVRVRLVNGVQTLLASTSLQIQGRPSSVDRQKDQTATRSSQSQGSASSGGEQGNGSSWRFGNPTNPTLSWAYVPAIRCALRLDTEDVYANTAVQAIGEEPFRAAVRALQEHFEAQPTEVYVGNGGYINLAEQNRVMGLVENTSDGQAFMLAASAAHERATPRGHSHEAPTSAGDQSEPSTSHHSRGNTAPQSYSTAGRLTVLIPIVVALVGIAIAIAWLDVVSRPDVVNPQDMSADDVQDWFRTQKWETYKPAFLGIDGKTMSKLTEKRFKDKIVAMDTSVGTDIYHEWHAQDERARSRMTAADVQKWFKNHDKGIRSSFSIAFLGLPGKILNEQTKEDFKEKVELANITPNYGSNIFNDWQLYCPVTSTMTAHNVTSWITERGWHDYAPLFNMTGGKLNQHTLRDIHQMLELKRARQDAPIVYNAWGDLVLRTSLATVELSVIAHPAVLGATVLAVVVYIWRLSSAGEIRCLSLQCHALSGAYQ